MEGMQPLVLAQGAEGVTKPERSEDGTAEGKRAGKR